MSYVDLLQPDGTFKGNMKQDPNGVQKSLRDTSEEALYLARRAINQEQFNELIVEKLASIGVSQYPGLAPENTLKFRTAMARRTGTNCIVHWGGPSTALGQTAPLTNNAAQDSTPYRIAKLLNDQGIPAICQSFFGGHNGWAAGNTPAGLAAGDSRITYTGSAALVALATIGGNALGFSAQTAGSWIFTPTQNVSKWVVQTGNATLGRTLRAVSGASGNVDIVTTGALDTVLTTINCGSSGLHPLTLSQQAGAPVIVGAYGYDDTNNLRQIIFINGGISGATTGQFIEDSSNYASTKKALSVLKPDLMVWSDLPINDWRNSVPLETSRSRMTTLVTDRPTSSDIIFDTPIWDSGTTGFSNNQDAYAQAVRDIAEEHNIGLVDSRKSWVSFADAQTRGWYGDNVHGTPLGYNVRAIMWAEVFRRIRAM